LYGKLGNIFKYFPHFKICPFFLTGLRKPAKDPISIDVHLAKILIRHFRLRTKCCIEQPKVRRDKLNNF
jgi:hypothetical protein